MLTGIGVDTTVFSGTFGAPVTNTSTIGGGERTTYACGNSDGTLTIEVARLPNDDAARKDADYAVQEQYEDMLSGPNGVKKRYSDGGGYLINPDTGVSRQTFTVGSWSILVEANFDDRAIARAEGKSDPVPTVIRTLDRIKTTVPESIQSGQW
ncbi:hypothetical protein AXK60_08535 [Tsukamurella pseudospumae]|uniref:Uncharacterized protein n=1 Tax=Tsukamurella pseudospumae TaxID=239498 RepID=A0A138ADY9_9ACTN|nr:hypothetical protein AXK60_08535 [Tsukamurella pseudospumae]